MVHVTPETVHFHYEIEKAGYRGKISKNVLDVEFVLHVDVFVSGLDRRHFPDRRSASSELNLQSRVHFRSATSTNLDEEWRPHGRYKEPSYTK